MNNDSNNISYESLERFYKGQVTEDERTLIEEYLFTSQVGLMEYLTIKREAEFNVVFLKTPTSNVKIRLLSSLNRLKPATVFQHRRGWMATACGFALICGVYLWQADQSDVPEITQQEEIQLNIDTALDASAGANFL